MTKTKLSIVRDGADGTEKPPKKTTVGEQFEAYADLIRKVADKTDIEPAALVQLWQVTLNYHLTRIQIGLDAPEGN